MRWSLAGVLGAIAASALMLAVPSAAGAETLWVCKPGLAENVCEGDQTTTIYSPDGGSRTETPRIPARRPIDCFYVYPTVSNQPGLNATLSIDPEIRAVTLYQAARFTQQCRVFAPAYRQMTLHGIAASTVIPEVRQIAYADVLAAWREYLREYNRGRGFVLIGHSQGTGMLRALVHNEIDGNRRVRRRLVSALLLGGDVVVREGRDRGGDFRNVPACRKRSQVGCVIAYSIFNEPPPGDSLFGRVDEGPDPLTGETYGPGYEVLCTNPGSLARNRDAAFKTLLPSEPFPLGLIAVGIVTTYGGPPPTAPTPWLEPADRYAGRCEESNGANVLMAHGIGDARHLNPSPSAGWGLHLVDVNGPLGNLQDLVAAQTRAYLRD